jgi:hypothetical protein
MYVEFFTRLRVSGPAGGQHPRPTLLSIDVVYARAR